MIRIGGSCGGRYSRPIAGITCYENRILQNNEHIHFYEDFKFCIKNGIYCIINIDTYMTDGRWKPSNQQLRDFILLTKRTIKSLGGNKQNCRFTYDNESEEYTNFTGYYNGVRVIHDALMGEFDLGAGNFGTNRRDWYEAIARVYHEKYYEVLDVHYQNGLVDVDSIKAYSDWLISLKKKYSIKRISVTEGNNFYNTSSEIGHSLLKYQIKEAERVGCEDFCFVYVNFDSNPIEEDDRMSYNIDSKPVKKEYWDNMLELIKLKNTIIEEEDMRLERFYYEGRNPTLIKDDKAGYGIMFLRKCFGLTHSNVFDQALTNKVKEYQQTNHLLVDGIVGPETFGNLILVKEYLAFYNWVHSLWARRLMY